MNNIQKITIGFVLVLGIGQIVIAKQDRKKSTASSDRQSEKSYGSEESRKNTQNYKSHNSRKNSNLDEHDSVKAPKINPDSMNVELFFDSKTEMLEGIQVRMGKCTSSKKAQPKISPAAIKQLMDSITGQQKGMLKPTK